MCGITGLVRPGGVRPGDRERVAAMTAVLTHRGPDGHDTWSDAHAVLGHRRLAIVDLSQHGAQPMQRGALSLTYNGEVYDAPLLRRRLAARGVDFAGHSDTEVVLRALEAWGAAAIPRFNGMFAFGLWDADRRRLTLARDRFGQKPLYYTLLDDGGLAFGSELRALSALPGGAGSLERLSLAKYLAFDGFPGHATPYRNVRKLPPGHTLTWTAAGVTISRYHRATYGTCRLHPDASAARVWSLLVRAVERRLMSDVPLGVFLSGGIDSSAVLAAMIERVDPRRIQTFAMGFDDPSFDESAEARAVARALGVSHHERRVSAGNVQRAAATVLDHLDEPLADVSVIPTYLLSKFAREHVTVALGGDGGDELFCGYDTFVADRLAGALGYLPRTARRGLRWAAERLPVDAANVSWGFRARRLLRGLHPNSVQRNQRWFGSWLPEDLVRLFPGLDPRAVYEDLRGIRHSEDLWTTRFLPDCNLTKVDRASMAVGLEVRAPFLDPDLARFAQSLPRRDKLRGLTRKWILRQAVRGKVPARVLQRPKRGFGAPAGTWLRGPLRDELRALTHDGRLVRSGWVDARALQRWIDAHLDGAADHRKQAWSWYVLARWAERTLP